MGKEDHIYFQVRMLWLFSLLLVAKKSCMIFFLGGEGWRWVVNLQWTTLSKIVTFVVLFYPQSSNLRWVPSLSFIEDAVERSRIFSKVSRLVSGKTRTWTSLSDPKELFPPKCIVSCFDGTYICCLKLFLIILLLNSIQASVFWKEVNSLSRRSHLFGMH